MSTVCQSQNVFMTKMKVSCNWRLFLWGIMRFEKSVSMASKGDVVVQSMSWRLKSPVIQMCLSEVMRVRDV